MSSPTPFSPLPRAMPDRRSHPGKMVRLEVQDPVRDAAELYRISHGTPEGEALWTFLWNGPFADEASFSQNLAAWGAQPDLIAYTVRHAETGAALGSISLMSLRPVHGVGELGNIWFPPAAQRTGANPEACFLLLRYCFEELGYRRMEWKCDARNEPSRRAAARLGFTYEGTFRQHMIVKNQNRDTAWFSITDKEWPSVREMLESRIRR